MNYQDLPTVLGKDTILHGRYIIQDVLGQDIQKAIEWYTKAAYTEAFKDNTSRIRNNNNAYDLLWWAKDDRKSEGEEAFRYKKIGASWWWLRSAYRRHLSYSFLRVDSEGRMDHNNADSKGGVLIGFCL